MKNLGGELGLFVFPFVPSEIDAFVVKEDETVDLHADQRREHGC